jgi:hypothetical protein
VKPAFRLLLRADRVLLLLIDLTEPVIRDMLLIPAVLLRLLIHHRRLNASVILLNVSFIRHNYLQ